MRGSIICLSSQTPLPPFKLFVVITHFFTFPAPPRLCAIKSRAQAPFLQQIPYPVPKITEPKPLCPRAFVRDKTELKPNSPPLLICVNQCHLWFNPPEPTFPSSKNTRTKATPFYFPEPKPLCHRALSDNGAGERLFQSPSFLPSTNALPIPFILSQNHRAKTFVPSCLGERQNRTSPSHLPSCLDYQIGRIRNRPNCE